LDESDTTKYVIHAKVNADGVVEQPDVVGAIFGQTEGLLGSDMDLRELQKSGRIGRIDVEISSNKGKSTGRVKIPSSLDKVETSILAAALETIDRVGPCIAHVDIEKVEDVRSSKRQLVVDRAKEILQEMFTENTMESQEIAESVKQAIRVEDAVSVGGLPAGPSVMESDAIIVVEGRADVLNLLRYGIKNTIAVEGTSVPEFVAELTKRKTVTAFTDGDRGGELIIKELLQVGDLDYIARAPEGKSVEDLTQKEVVKALRGKVTADQYVEALARRERGRGGRVPEPRQERERPERVERPEKAYRVEGAEREPSRKQLLPKRKTLIKGEVARAEARPPEAPEAARAVSVAPPHREAVRPPRVARPNPYHDQLTALAGTLSAKILGEGDRELRTVAVRDLANTLKEASGDVRGVVFDGVVTQRLLDIAAERGLGFIAGVKMGNVVKQPTNVKVLTLQ